MDFRQITAGGGAIYTWRHFRSFHPYLKYEFGFGRLDTGIKNPKYAQLTRTVTMPGLGIEYRVFRNVWVRADYEYQSWSSIQIPPNTHGGGILDPQGFTLGASYHFNRFRLR